MADTGLINSIVYRDRLKDMVLPIEVKYRSMVDLSDIKGMLRFMDTYRLNKGVVVTRDVFAERDGKLLFVPAWLFLLTE